MRRRTPFRLIVVVSALYSACLGILTLLWRLRPQAGLVIISRIFAAQLFWPLLVLVPAALGSRSRLLQALAAWPVLLFGAMFGKRFLPRMRQHRPGHQLRVATYNLNFRNEDFPAIIAAIRSLQADVVALQELTPWASVAIVRELDECYPYQLLAPVEKQHGLGIISRFPFAETHDEIRFRGQRVAFSVAGRVLTLINAHPTVADIEWRALFGRIAIPWSYEPGLRAEQIRALEQTIDRIQGELIVVGDFNTAESETLYAGIASRMRDAFIEVGYGLGFTFPVEPKHRFRPPLVRIDYVWYRGAIAARSARVVRANGGSDHCIVVADLVLQ